MANFEFGVNRKLKDLLWSFGQPGPRAVSISPVAPAQPNVVTPKAQSTDLNNTTPPSIGWDKNLQLSGQPQMYSFDQVGNNIANIPAAPNSPVKQTKKRPTTGPANILETLLKPVTEAEKQKYYSSGGVQTIRGTMDPKERISAGYFNPTTGSEYNTMREAIEGTAFPQAAVTRETDMDLLKEQERTKALLSATKMDITSKEKLAAEEQKNLLSALEQLLTNKDKKATPGTLRSRLPSLYDDIMNPDNEDERDTIYFGN